MLNGIFRLVEKSNGNGRENWMQNTWGRIENIPFRLLRRSLGRLLYDFFLFSSWLLEASAQQWPIRLAIVSHWIQFPRPNWLFDLKIVYSLLLFERVRNHWAWLLTIVSQITRACAYQKNDNRIWPMKVKRERNKLAKNSWWNCVKGFQAISFDFSYLVFVPFSCGWFCMRIACDWCARNFRKNENIFKWNNCTWMWHNES